MHDLIARMALATHISPAELADLDHDMFNALAAVVGFELRDPDGVH